MQALLINSALNLLSTILIIWGVISLATLPDLPGMVPEESMLERRVVGAASRFPTDLRQCCSRLWGKLRPWLW
jgi:hypothetical protein